MVSSGLLFDLSRVCGGQQNEAAPPTRVPVADSAVPSRSDPFSVTTIPVQSTPRQSPNGGTLDQLTSLYREIDQIEQNYFSAIRAAAAPLNPEDRNAVEAFLTNREAELGRFRNFCDTRAAGDGIAGQLRRRVAPSFCEAIAGVNEQARRLERSLPASREPKAGSCECPYDTDSRGRTCGGRSAFSRGGGRSGACYIR